MLAQENGVTVMLHLQSQVGVDPASIFGEHVESIAKGRLMHDQQADQPDVGDLPMLGHPEADRHAAGHVGAVLQQMHDRSGRKHLFGIAHHRARQACPPQQRQGVDLQFSGDREIAGQ